MSVAEIFTTVGKHLFHPGDSIPLTPFQWHHSIQLNEDRLGIAYTMLRLHILTNMGFIIRERYLVLKLLEHRCLKSGTESVLMTPEFYSNSQ